MNYENICLAADGSVATVTLNRPQRRNALYLGDHGLWDRLNLRHQLGADVEDAAVFVDVAAGHFQEVVAGAEDFSPRRKNNSPDLAIAADFVEARDGFLHERERECVTALGPVEREDGSPAILRVADVLEGHNSPSFSLLG